MNLRIDPKSKSPIYEQIEKGIKEVILNKELKEGEMLPSIRSLAADLKISVITTKRAYEELEKEGIIYSVAGKGFFVDNPNMDYLEEKRTLDIEEEMTEMIDKSKKSGMTKKEFTDMINILWED